MCGRYNLFSDVKVVGERFQAMADEEAEGLLEPRYNIAPGQMVPAITQANGRRLMSFFRWGLIPGWADDPKIGYKMINARAETVHSKPSFKGLMKRRRCLIPADGFYEWKKQEGKKQPYHIYLKDHDIFAFAGLWDEWEREGEVIRSCTIITTEANEMMKPIHHRMPVILTREAEADWMDPGMPSKEAAGLLQPFSSAEMDADPISAFVNNARNEGKEILNSL